MSETVILDDDTGAVTGTAGDDLLEGAAGPDRLKGLDGADSVLGGPGNDTLEGGFGDDTLEGGSGADVLDGGVGFDIVSYRGAAGPVRVGGAFSTLAGDALGDTYSWIERIIGSNFDDRFEGSGDRRGGQGRDTLIGSFAGDTLGGGLGDDRLDGGSGDDLLLGGAGNDRLDADGAFPSGSRNDTIDGGRGADTLLPGDGADVIVLRGPRAGIDTIVFFEVDVDVFQLSSEAFGGRLLPGSLSADSFALGNADAAGPQFVYDAAAGALSWDRDGTGDAAAMLLATLSNRPTIAASDFVILA